MGEAKRRRALGLGPRTVKRNEVTRELFSTSEPFDGRETFFCPGCGKVHHHGPIDDLEQFLAANFPNPQEGDTVLLDWEASWPPALRAR